MARTIKTSPNKNVGEREKYKKYCICTRSIGIAVLLNIISSWCLTGFDWVTGDHCYVGDGVKNKVYDVDCVSERGSLRTCFMESATRIKIREF